jgi:hypothetical protein
MYQLAQYRAFFNMMRAAAAGGPPAYTYAEQEVSLKALASFGPSRLIGTCGLGSTKWELSLRFFRNHNDNLRLPRASFSA